MLHAFIQFLIQIVGSLQFLLIVNSDIPGMSGKQKEERHFLRELSTMCKAVQVTKITMTAKLQL